MDLRWFERGEGIMPMAVRGAFRLKDDPKVEILAKYVPVCKTIDADRKRGEMLEGAVIFSHGRGQLWVTQLLHETGTRDPIPARVLRNLFLTAANHLTNL